MQKNSERNTVVELGHCAYTYIVCTGIEKIIIEPKPSATCGLRNRLHLKHQVIRLLNSVTSVSNM